MPPQTPQPTEPGPLQISPVPPQASPTTEPPQPPTPQQTPAYASPVLETKKKRFPKWLKIVGIVIASIVGFLIFIAITANLSTRAPQKVSDQFVNYVQAGDAANAYKLTSDVFRTATTEPQLDELVQRIKPNIQGEEKVTARGIFASTSSKSSTAVLVYTIDNTQPAVYLKTQLQKKDGTWQIVNFRSSYEMLQAQVE